MADAQERTEQPTSKRLSDARKKGQVPMSAEMVSAVTIVILTAVTALRAPAMVNWMMEEISYSLKLDHMKISNARAFSGLFQDKLISAGVMMMPFMLALLIGGYIVNMAISGSQFNTSQIFKVETNQLNPIKGLTRLFSMQSVVKLLISILKLVFVGGITYFYLKDKILELATYQWIWDMGILTAISKLILGVAVRLCVAIVILGIIDLVYQKWKYIDGLKMSKKEVKDERKNMDTPPEVRKKIRQKQFETSMMLMMKKVPEADVVLVNPTHVAVALKYDPDSMQAPTVVAKGGDHICEKIKETARAYGVPIIRRPALARELFARVDIDHPIPDSLYVAVAEILALVYRLKRSMSTA